MSTSSLKPSAFILVLLWAANWPASQLALEEMPPISFRIITLVGGAIALLLFCMRHDETLVIQKRFWPKLIALSLLNIGIFNVLSAYTITTLEGGRAAIIAFTMPVWVVIIEIFLGRKLSNLTIYSIIIGFSGFFVVLFSVVTDNQYDPVSFCLMGIAALSWAAGSVWLAQSTIHQNAGVTAMWMMVISSVFVVLLLPLQSEALFSFPKSSTAWLGLLFAGMIGMGLCQLMWFTILHSIGPIHAAFVLLAIPPMGVFLSWLIVDARVTTPDIVGLLLLLISAACNTLSRDKTKPKKPFKGTPLS